MQSRLLVVAGCFLYSLLLPWPVWADNPADHPAELKPHPHHKKVFPQVSPDFLTDETPSPETNAAQLFFQSISYANGFSGLNYGSIGSGDGGIRDSYKLFSRSYISENSEDDFLKSFQNTGYSKLLQLYSTAVDPASETAGGKKRVFFEISYWAGDEDMAQDLYMGGQPPKTTGASQRNFYGFMDFVTEDGALKIDNIEYQCEFPFGGGHQPWRDGVEYMGQLAMGEGFSNSDMDTNNCQTRVIHPGRLALVTCASLDGKQKKTAKMVYPMGSVAGWICIGMAGEPSPTSEKESEHVRLGKKFAGRKDFDGAIAEYQKAIGADVGDFEAFELMGYAYYRQGLNDKAIEALEESIKINPNHLFGYYNLALAYWAKGDQASALAELKKLFELDGSFREKVKADHQFKVFTVSKEFNDLVSAK